MAVQKATFVTAAAVQWSSAVNFDGYVLLILALPTGYSQVSIAGNSPTQTVSQRVRIPVRDGQLDPTVQAFFTSSLEPPNCLWSPFWYDAQDTLLYTPLISDCFALTSSPKTLTVPTLTATAATSTVPTP